MSCISIAITAGANCYFEIRYLKKDAVGRQCKPAAHPFLTSVATITSPTTTSNTLINTLTSQLDFALKLIE